MPKEKKPGWQYFFSEYFNEEFAIHEESGWVYFSTKEGIVKYSPAEFELLNKHGLKLDLATHRVKTIIGGELVDIKPIPKPPEPVTRQVELEIW
ncbi:hypothetical protein [Treponema sp. R80B11-R83G3]